MIKVKKRKTALRGSATISLMLIIIIIGAVMLVGGIFPKPPILSHTPREAIPDTTSINPGKEDALQLKTLKFKDCRNTITVDLLLDRSDSMGEKTPTGVKKIDRLKEAVIALTNTLNDNSVIGIQSFSSDSITNDVPISSYPNVKGSIVQKINSLKNSGQTPTHDALNFSLGKLRDALPQYPNRKFTFIFVSDGEPIPGRGQPNNQDPRDHTPNPADEIKNLGVIVYTLGIYDSKQAVNPKLAELLKSIASKPENYFEASTADETTKLLSAISAKICGGN